MNGFRIAAVNRFLERRSCSQILLIAICEVGFVAAVDYATGYEASVSLFYLIPVATAVWYADLRAGFGIAVLSCVCWFALDIIGGHTYEHPAIPIWNANVRLGFFLITGLLVAALKDNLSHQQHLARTDPLTGACSRRAFEERLEHDLELARRHRSPLTLAVVDLDNFKALNDTRGHGVGDQALRAAALAMQRVTRRTDTVARLGGDEFALALPDTGGPGAAELISKLNRELQQVFAAFSPTLSCSVGVITFVDRPPEMESALRAADALMYDAKRGGKHRVVFRVVT